MVDENKSTIKIQNISKGIGPQIFTYSQEYDQMTFITKLPTFHPPKSPDWKSNNSHIGIPGIVGLNPQKSSCIKDLSSKLLESAKKKE